MFKLLFKLICLALAVTLIALAVVLFAPYDRDTAYSYAPITDTDDGGKLAWVHERVKRPIDYAFIGSSHTLRGIDDELIENAVHGAGYRSVKVCNLGRNFIGRNLDYLVVKELLERQKPRVIFLEVPDRIPVGGHVLFPILADRKDFFSAANAGNARLARDLNTAFNSRFDTLAASVCRSVPKQRRFRYGEHGYLAVDGRLDAPEAAGINAQKGVLEKYFPAVYRLLQEEDTGYRCAYTERIVRLARQKGTRVVFLYLPIFNKHDIPKGYRKEDILFPPAGIFDKAENFADIAHLNPRGAQQLSVWLAGKVAQDLAEQSGVKQQHD